MSKRKFWQYTCDNCQKTANFDTHQQAIDAGWVERGHETFCSSVCQTAHAMEQL